MFGVRAFFIKTLLLWCLVSVVLVESNRQKKDVHHMIILNQEVRPSKQHRHKYGSSRTKRKPVRSSKPKHSGSSKESFETSSSEEDVVLPHKTKSKRHQQKRDRHRHHQSDNDNYIQPSESYPWTPMSSREFFGRNPSSGFPPRYPQGSLYYPQPVPIEITSTTPFSMPPNSFFSYESTLYPPLNTIKPMDTYRPYDYSVLGQRPQSGIGEASFGKATPLSIIVENLTENGGKGDGGTMSQDGVNNKGKRARGTSRFNIRKKNKNNN